MYKIILYFLFSNFLFAQEFIILDKENDSLISEVNYKVFSNGVKIIDSKNTDYEITKLPINIKFDSILFSKIGYKKKSVQNFELKKIVQLEPVINSIEPIIVTNSKELIIGEKGKFINRKINLTKQTDFILRFENTFNTEKKINSIILFVNQPKHKIEYKIEFYENFEETKKEMIKPLLLSKLICTDTGFILPSKKNQINLTLNKNFILPKKGIIIRIIVVNYYNEENKIFEPTNEECLKIKTQKSKEYTYYTKFYNSQTNNYLDGYINQNFFYKTDNPNLKDKWFFKPAIYLELIN